MHRACLGKPILFFVLFSSILISPFPVTVSAETRYVSDILVIALRAAPDNDSEVIQKLYSDAPLEILEEKENFVRVRTGSGQEGWVIKRYTISNIPKSMVIAELGEKIKRLELSLESVEKEKKQLEMEPGKIQNNPDNTPGAIQSTNEQDKKEMERIITEHQEISEKYNQLLTQSKNVIQLSQQMEAMEKENIKLRASKKKGKDVVRTLKNIKDTFFQADMIPWFLAGSGVLLAGILLGKVSRRKEYY
jgi:SH3 domain protein